MRKLASQEQNSCRVKRISIVTGANGNLGRAVVEKFLDLGDLTFGIVRRASNNQHADTNNYAEHVLDLSDENACLSLVDSLIKHHTKIDNAVLTAGGFAMGKVRETSTADILHQYKLNFETAYNIVRPVFTQMMAQGHGRIFLIGSKAGYDTSQAKGVTAYALSKSLLFSLANILNTESRGKDIVTTVIVPGIIDTPQNRKDMPEADTQLWVKPEQIADVIAYYSSLEADIIREPVVKVYGKL